ncbi:MAG: hypothetical protein NC102_07990 [Clostridium sp.]|nr:hypothetical protein [Clostridium sp.]
MIKSLSHISLVGAMAMAATLMPSCIDDNYDLSDIDTNVEIRVDDLVVPVNLDAITLSNIFDLDDESAIKNIDGEYAIMVDGDFESKEIKVAAVSLGKPEIPATTTTVNLLGSGLGGLDIPSINIGSQVFRYEVESTSTSFTYKTDGVDKSIRSLEKIGVEWTLEIALKIDNTSKVFKTIVLHDMKLEIPAGLHTSGVENVDGTISLGDIRLENGKADYTLVLAVDEIDVARMGDKFRFTAKENAAGMLEIDGSIGIGGGYVVAETYSTISSVPAKTSLTLSPKGSAIEVKSVDGEIRYGIDDFGVDPITLNDLPDFMREEGTNITIAHPRLYLSINNPMAGFGLKASSGLTLVACRDNGREPFGLNSGSLIEIGSNKGEAGPYNFCLSPDDTPAQSAIEGYDGAEHVGYDKLRDVVGGDGLPNSIEVEFENPHVGPGMVRGFALPQDLSKVKGTYCFYAPLDLGEGSTIIYEGDEAGWADDTMDKITVEKLGVQATVSNILPFDIELSGYPVDSNGNQCKDKKTGQLVKFTATKIPAGTTAPISIECSGTVSDVDGIYYYAKAYVSKEGIVLRPDATITLTGIRATVSGYYADEL